MIGEPRSVCRVLHYSIGAAIYRYERVSGAIDAARTASKSRITHVSRLHHGVRLKQDRNGVAAGTVAFHIQDGCAIGAVERPAQMHGGSWPDLNTGWRSRPISRGIEIARRLRYGTTRTCISAGAGVRDIDGIRGECRNGRKKN